MSNFWTQLPTPFFAIAPMADVTDAPFRAMIAKYSNGESQAGGGFVAAHNSFVTWTEFVSADGLVRAPEEGKQKLLADLVYSEAERPIVAQLFSSTPAHMEYAAALCRELGFDGVDINMGCPDKSIEKQGCGSAMIKSPAVATAVIAAAKRGARMGATDGIPVSVKTRVGYYEDEVETWIPHLLASEPAALTIHARTRQEMSKVPARWDRVGRVVEIRDALGVATKIIGNGDVLSQADGRAKAQLARADGIMVGRALFGNPWFFHPTKQLPHRLLALPTSGVNREELIELTGDDTAVEYVSLQERLQVLVEHSQLFTELLPHKSFNIMKKHYKGYVNGFSGAAELRKQLMAEATTPTEVTVVVQKFLDKHTR